MKYSFRGDKIYSFWGDEVHSFRGDEIHSFRDDERHSFMGDEMQFQGWHVLRRGRKLNRIETDWSLFNNSSFLWENRANIIFKEVVFAFQADTFPIDGRFSVPGDGDCDVMLFLLHVGEGSLALYGFQHGVRDLDVQVVGNASHFFLKIL